MEMETQKNETKTEKGKPNWKIKATDFRPIFGAKDYRNRNGFQFEPSFYGMREEVESRIAYLNGYNMAVMGGLAYAAYQVIQALTGQRMKTQTYTITKRIAKHGNQAIIVVPKILESELRPGLIVELNIVVKGGIK